MRLTLAIAAAVLVAACSPFRDDVPRPDSRAIDRPEETFLGRAFAAQLAGAPGESGVRWLISGQEAFLARAALAEAAERTLDLQYYVVGEDAAARSGGPGSSSTSATAPG